MPRPHPAPAVPTLTFRGAARTVTGSLHQLDVGSATVLLDCGLFQGPRAEARLRNADFPVKPKRVAAVLLSHAHLDHCGNLPNLVRQGFVGPIFCTPATRALAAVMLGDAAKIHEEDAVYRNRHRAAGTPPVEPLYTGRDVFRTLLRLRAVPYGTPFEAVPGVQARFSDAGHLLGSAVIHLRIETPDGVRTLTYTGDLGRPGLPIVRDPEPVPPADLLLCESTYGGQYHEPTPATEQRLGDVVRRTVRRGGTVIIPAFSVGRTQTVVWYLHRLRAAGALPELPIYVDSPMAARATEVFRAHPECYDAEALNQLAADPDLFGDGCVRYVEKVHESIALNGWPGPGVIISASGMCEAGRVVHHLRHHVEDRRHTVLLVGYQAAGTLGRRLAEHPPSVRVLGRTLTLRAEVEALTGLSGHADHGDLLRALTPLAGQVGRVRLVHGEPERAEALATALRAAGFADVAVPAAGESVAV